MIYINFSLFLNRLLFGHHITVNIEYLPVNDKGLFCVQRGGITVGGNSNLPHTWGGGDT